MFESKEGVGESARTKKMREKLKKKMQKIEQKITPEAIEKTVREMHKWIAQNGKDREPLRSKGISLFDENQNTAQVSRKIALLVEQLQKDSQAPAGGSAEERKPDRLLKKVLLSSQKQSLPVEKK